MLMLYMVVGPTFQYAAHAHVGIAVEQDSHDERPHIHLHLGKHQHHHHGPDRDRNGANSQQESSQTGLGNAPFNHNSDAFYVDDAQLFCGIRTKNSSALPTPAAAVLADSCGALILAQSSDAACNFRSAESRPRCPLYLRMLCIRC